jgi:hypothetical protein
MAGKRGQEAYFRRRFFKLETGDGAGFKNKVVRSIQILTSFF